MISIKKYLSVIMALILMNASLTASHAAMVTNERVMNDVRQTDARAALLQAVQRTEVREQLLAMGVNPQDVEVRVQSMTQEEIAQLSQHIDELPAGGDVLGVLLLLFLVFIFTDIIGATNIFSFVHPVN